MALGDRLTGDASFLKNNHKLHTFSAHFSFSFEGDLPSIHLKSDFFLKLLLLKFFLCGKIFFVGYFFSFWPSD